VTHLCRKFVTSIAAGAVVRFGAHIDNDRRRAITPGTRQRPAASTDKETDVNTTTAARVPTTGSHVDSGETSSYRDAPATSHRRRAARRAASSTLLAVVVAAGMWAGNDPTAQAPEPAKIKAALPASTGASASAYFVTTLEPTTVRYYSAVYTSDPNGPAAGTPCSTSSLVGGATSYQRIEVATKPDGTPLPLRRCR
jgi:hypothetical protein